MTTELMSAYAGDMSNDGGFCSWGAYEGDAFCKVGHRYSEELDMCGSSAPTAVPSPALTYSQGFSTWGPQDFENFDNFVLSNEGDSTFGGTEAEMELHIACADHDGGVVFPEDLFPEQYGGQLAAWGDEGLLGSFEPGQSQQAQSGLGAYDVEPQGTGDPGSDLSLAGHAATGDWAWRIAPRPPASMVEALGSPLVVVMGGNPDGSALLEVALGLRSEEDPPMLLCCH